MKNLFTPHRLALLLAIALAWTMPQFTIAQNTEAPGIKLLQPLPGDVKVIPAINPNCPNGDPICSTYLGSLNFYVQHMFPWMVGVGAGLAVFMIIFGGIQIILSDGDQGEITKGKKRIYAALFGLSFLVFSATILNLLNSWFFKLGSLT